MNGVTEDQYADDEFEALDTHALDKDDEDDGEQLTMTSTMVRASA